MTPWGWQLGVETCRNWNMSQMVYHRVHILDDILNVRTSTAGKNKKNRNHWTGVCVGPEPIWVFWRTKKCLTPTGIGTPDRPVHTLYRISYVGSKIQIFQDSIMLNKSLAYLIPTKSQELALLRKICAHQISPIRWKTTTFHRFSIAQFVITIYRPSPFKNT